MSIAWFFFDALRAAALLGAALVVGAALRQAHAATRRTVLVAAMVATLFAPLAARILAASPASTVVDLPFLSVKPAAEPIGVEIVPAVVDGGGPRRAVATPGGETIDASTPRIGATALLVLLWGFGAAVVVARLGCGLLGARRLVKRARREDARPFMQVIARTLREAKVAAEVAISDDIDTPAVAGLIRPIVLMPRSAVTWNENRWRVVLLHEFAHVRRCDCLIEVVAQLVCAVHWFDPLAWRVRARWRKERELAADEDVLTRGVRPSEYAEHLLHVANVTGAEDVPSGALAMAGQPSDFAHRLERIVQKGTLRPSSRWAALGVVAASCALTLAVACAGPADPLAAGARPAAAGVSASDAPRTTRTPPNARPHQPVEPSLARLAEQVAGVIGSPAERNELTIDPALQAIADEETSQVISAFHARAATAIILDPAKGEILALANPDVARQAYVTGSTMKALTIAAALDAGVVRVDQKIDCRPRPREFPAVNDATPHGWLDLAEIMEVSSNVGALRVFQALGDRRFDDALPKFHLGERAPVVQLPFKPFSLGRSRPSRPIAGEKALGAIGEGFVTTPLQMIAVYGVFANGGEYVAPSLVRHVRDEGGRTHWRHAPQREPVVRPETAQAMMGILELAVDGKKATGKAARVPGVRVAGKTGTSMVDEPDGSQAYASFIGIVPADAPRYVILVGVVDPGHDGWGGTVAAPAFARIATRALALSR